MLQSWSKTPARRPSPPPSRLAGRHRGGRVAAPVPRPGLRAPPRRGVPRGSGRLDSAATGGSSRLPSSSWPASPRDGGSRLRFSSRRAGPRPAAREAGEDALVEVTGRVDRLWSRSGSLFRARIEVGRGDVRRTRARSREAADARRRGRAGSVGHRRDRRHDPRPRARSGSRKRQRLRARHSVSRASRASSSRVPARSSGSGARPGRSRPSTPFTRRRNGG